MSVKDMLSKEQVKFYLDKVFKSEYQKACGTAFGTYKKRSDGIRERDIAIGFIYRLELSDPKTLVEYTRDMLKAWRDWPEYSRANVVKYVFSEQRYKKWDERRRKGVAGRTEYWNEF